MGINSFPVFSPALKTTIKHSGTRHFRWRNKNPLLPSQLNLATFANHHAINRISRHDPFSFSVRVMRIGGRMTAVPLSVYFIENPRYFQRFHWLFSTPHPPK